MNKIKILWFLVVPIAWLLSLKLIEWITYYPVSCSTSDSPVGICMWFAMTGIFGVLGLVVGSIILAFYMQE